MNMARTRTAHTLARPHRMGNDATTLSSRLRTSYFFLREETLRTDDFAVFKFFSGSSSYRDT